MIAAAKAKPSGVMRSPFFFSHRARAFRQQLNIRGHVDTIGLWSDAAIPIVVLLDGSDDIKAETKEQSVRLMRCIGKVGAEWDAIPGPGGTCQTAAADVLA
jgi:hypothetical protein